MGAAEPVEGLEPVYDDRGNVRPHGTPGARPMTFEERVEIARSLGNLPEGAAPKRKARK